MSWLTSLQASPLNAKKKKIYQRARTIRPATQGKDRSSLYWIALVPERCCVVSVFKVNRHISDRFSCHFLELCKESIEPKQKSTTGSEDWVLRELDSGGNDSAEVVLFE